MLSNPKVGTLVVIWYARKPGWARVTPLHGKTGIVVEPGRGKPRNHLVRLLGRFDYGRRVIVPAGNLRRY